MEASNQLEPGTDKKQLSIHYCVLATVITQSQLHIQMKYSLANLLGCGANIELWYNAYACTLGPALLCLICTYYAFQQCSKSNLLCSIFNIMHMITVIMLQFIHNFITLLSLIGSSLLCSVLCYAAVQLIMLNTMLIRTLHLIFYQVAMITISQKFY